jgi:dTDP-glucose 4,6-dehydratase
MVVKRLVVTGGYGFIGSNFIRYWLSNYCDDIVVNLDNCTYAAVKESLADVEAKYNARYFFEKADISSLQAVDAIIKKHNIDTIVNFAAESHNSNSIHGPASFYRANSIGAQTLMEAVVKNACVKRIHHISTCEVYGDMPLECDVPFTENSPLGGNSPYSSSKACAHLIANAYVKTFNIPITISVCSNNYGPFQFPEKLIPLFVTNVIKGKPLTLYKESGFKREWLHVIDHCQAIDIILREGEIGQVYNIGSGVEKSVEDIADIILDYFGKTEKDKIYVPSRPSHDRRYLLDCTKLKSTLGWNVSTPFDDGIRNTIEWYINNRQWWEPLLTRRLVEENTW